MSKEVGAGGGFDIFLDSGLHVCSCLRILLKLNFSINSLLCI